MYLKPFSNLFAVALIAERGVFGMLKTGWTLSYFRTFCMVIKKAIIAYIVSRAFFNRFTYRYLCDKIRNPTNPAGEPTLRYRRPACLEDTKEIVTGAITAFLGSPDAHLNDNGRRSKRFCLNKTCNPDLHCFSTMPVPHDEVGLRVCEVLVPNACPHCSFEPEELGFTRVKFYATKEQYHAYIAVRANKHQSDKKSMHVALTTICEGFSYNLFHMADEMLLEHGAIINHLQCCRLAFHFDTAFQNALYQMYSNFGVWAASWVYRWNRRFYMQWMDRLLPYDPVTGTDYATEWRTFSPTDHVYGKRADKGLLTQDDNDTTRPTTGLRTTEEHAAPRPTEVPARPPTENTTTPQATKTVVTPATSHTRAGSSADIAPAARATIEAARNALARQETQVREHDGLLPVRVVGDLTDEDRQKLDVIDSHSKNTGPPKRRGLSEKLEFEKLMLPGWRKDLIVKYKLHIFQVAPLLSNTVIYDDKDAITKAAAATERVLQPGTWTLGEKFPEDSPENIHRNAIRALCQSNLKRFFKACKRNLFCPTKVGAFVAKLPLIEELRSPKLTAARFLELIDEMRVAVKLPKISANVKLEVIAKPNKSPRIVFDCGLEISVVDTLVAYVYEHMLKDWVEPAMIKGKAREQVLNSISEECSVNTSGRRRIFTELDQTGFDGHNRKYLTPKESIEAPGIMAELLDVFQHVGHLIAKSANDCWKQFTVKGEKDCKSDRHYIKFGAKEPADRWTAVIKELYQFSGKKTTSSGNWLSECAIDICTNVGNPEAIWDQPLKEFNWVFLQFGESFRAAKEESRKPYKVFYRFWLEGDDQFGWGDEAIATQAPDAALLQEDMGFQAKRIIARASDKDERLEFIGVHFLTRNGLTIKGMWVPDIARALTCCGAYISDPAEKDPLVRAANAGISLLSRAFMMAGRNDPACSYLRSVGEEWVAAAGAAADAVRASGFKSEVYGLSGASAKALIDMIDANVAVGLSDQNQIRLMSCSIQGTVSTAEFAKFAASATGISSTTTSADALAMLPAALQLKLAGTVV